MRAEILDNKVAVGRNGQDQSGQILTRLLILSLAVMFLRLELMESMEVAGSFNKAVSGGLFPPAGVFSLPSSWRHGGEQGRLVRSSSRLAAGCSGVRMLLQDEHSRRPFDWRPTQKTIGWSDSKLAMFQASSTSMRRPSLELDAAPHALLAPSGVVPGSGERGRVPISSSSSGGRGRGLDGVFNCYFRVLSAVLSGRYVILIFFGGPYVTCTCTVDLL